MALFVLLPYKISEPFATNAKFLELMWIFPNEVLQVVPIIRHLLLQRRYKTVLQLFDDHFKYGLVYKSAFTAGWN